MANFRAFTIYNRDKTASIELNDLNGYLVTSPTGLGIYLNNSYLNVGTKRIKTGQTLAFRPITMIIDIVGGTRQILEEKYAALRDFIASHRRGGFCLAYKPHENLQERYIECEIKDFDKTEKSTSRYMAIPVNIEPRTYWLVDAPTQSTEVEPLASNMWSFSEQDYNTPIESYEVRDAQATGETELTVYGGYDKSVLPQGVRFVASITNNSTGVDYAVSFNLDGHRFENGVLVLERTFQKSSYLNAEEKFVVRFDTANASIKAICELWMDDKTDLSSVYYNLDLREGLHQSVAVFEFDSTAIDEEVEIVLYWLDHAGNGKTGTYRKKRGDKYKYITMEDFASWDTQNINTVQTVERVNVPVYMGVTIATNYTWSVYGTLTKGSRDFAAGYLFDADTDEYCIAFSSSRKTKAEITNDGDNEIPLRVRVYGVAVNPIVRIVPNGGGTAIQETKINTEIPAGAYLEINSDPERVGAWLVYDSGVRRNVTTKLDQTTNMFLTLPVGEYEIEAVDESDTAVQMDIFVKIEYLGA